MVVEEFTNSVNYPLASDRTEKVSSTKLHNTYDLKKKILQNVIDKT